MSAKNHLIEVLNALAIEGYEPTHWTAPAINRARRYLQEEICHEEREQSAAQNQLCHGSQKES